MSDETHPAAAGQVELTDRPRVRYVLHPGYVTSAADGQEHFIGGPRLASLYGVDIRDQFVVVFGDMPGYREMPGDVHLYPSRDGNYRLPNANSASKDGKHSVK